MRFILFVACVFILTHTHAKTNPKQFDTTLNQIAEAFKEGILDYNECERLRNVTKDLVLDIEREVLQPSKYSTADMEELKQLKKDGDALERFMGVLGNCGHYYLTIEMFELANKRLKGTTQALMKNENCLQVIAYNIAGYQYLFFENTTEVQYKITYRWKEIDGFRYGDGDGSLGILKSSITNIIDNRFNPQSKFFLYDMVCKER